jgi:hypothetical protein
MAPAKVMSETIATKRRVQIMNVSSLSPYVVRTLYFRASERRLVHLQKPGPSENHKHGIFQIIQEDNSET